MAPSKLAKQTCKVAPQDAAAAHRLAGWYARGEEGLSQDFQLAVRWERVAAERKCADAQCAIGEAYEYGAVGLQVDHAAAFVLIEKAALQGRSFPTYTSPYFLSLT
jgi:TPR repeat protein